MLSKITRALTKQRYEDNDSPAPNIYSPAPNRERHLSVSNAVLSAHPNLSVFHSSTVNLTTKGGSHDSDDEDHDNEGPPPSPTKRSLKTFFKRSSKLNLLDMQHPGESSSRVSLPAPPRKKRTGFQHDTFEPPDSSGRQTPSQPITPATSGPKHSIRSILRTPGEATNPDHTQNSSRTPNLPQGVRFFSREVYNDEEPERKSHSRTSSRTGNQDTLAQELGGKPKSSSESNRAETISLLDRLRQEGKMESPSNALTFMAAQVSTEDLLAHADPFSNSRDAPSMLPLPTEEVPRTSMDSIRSAQQEYRTNEVVDPSHGATSRSIDIPTGMSNLLDTYQAEPEEPLLPQVSMSDGMYADLQEQMKDAPWMPEALSLDFLNHGNSTEVPTVETTTNGTVRQRSITLPPCSPLADDEMFQSLAQSSPAMNRTSSSSNRSSGSSNRSGSPLHRTGSSPPIAFPMTDDPIPKTPVFSRLAPPAASQDLTQWYTPTSAPAHRIDFTPDPRRADSDPPVFGARAANIAPPLTEIFGTEDSLIQSLRSQLLVQSSLVSHYEAELKASQALVSSLTNKLDKTTAAFDKYKEESAKRREAMTRLKRKVRELEGMVDEAEGERSQRSMLDECTAGAMLVLQERCLEAEEKYKHEKQRCDGIEAQLEGLKETLESFNATQNSIFIDRPDLIDGDQIEELKAKIEELQKVEAERKELEVELDKLREENATLKKGSEINKHDSKATELLDNQLETLRQIIRDRSEELEEVKQKFDTEMSERGEQIATLKQEVESHWKSSEEVDEKLKLLRDTVIRKEERLQEKEEETDRLVSDYQALEARCREMEEEWNASEERRAVMEEDAEKVTETTRQLENERNGLSEQVRHERSEVARLSRAVQELQSDLHQLDEERRFAVDEAERLNQNLRNREEETSSDNKKLASLARERDDLEVELSRVRRENARLLEQQQQRSGDVSVREERLKIEVQELVKRKAEEDVTRESLGSRVKSLEEEVSRGQKKIGELKSQSADHEVELVQLRKALTKDQEDKANLEIALQAKQQELDLIKRRLVARGDATPASSKAGSRRESTAPTAFATPMLPPSRPSSAMSNATTPRESNKSAAPLKHRASLALSPRSLNTPDAGTPEATSTAKRARFTETTMSPPSTKRLSTSSVSSVTGVKGSSSAVAAAIAKSTTATARTSLASSTSSTASYRRSANLDTPLATAKVTRAKSTAGFRALSKSESPEDTKENKIPTITLRRKTAMTAA